MVRKIVLAGFCIVWLAASLAAQERPMRGSEDRSMKRMKEIGALMKELSTQASPRHSFDVLNYTLSLDLYQNFLTPFPRTFSASNTITFRVDSTLNSIQLNAATVSLTIDSVGLAAKAKSQVNDILTLTLDTTYHAGDTVRVKIYYRHNNIADGALYVNSGMVFTDCEPEGARHWFPCWDHPSDKATIDLTAKVPSSVRLGSNGKCVDSTQSADTIRYHWISRDPVSTYLVVISAKVGYNRDVVYWRKLSNLNDSIPIVFYWNAGETVASLRYMENQILPMMSHYSVLFGEHPFEKNGFATLNTDFYFGGMENQTLTSLCPNCWNENLISHEFAHQWFGDMITCGTWADVWLNEGFATYCESLWYEYTGGYGSYKNDILNDANFYLGNNPGWPIYNPSWTTNTPSINTLFNTAITYDKGACVLHMLRYVLGDSLFFASLKAYATDSVNFKFKSSVTDDFAAKMSSASGRDLSWFFDEWLKQPNHPTYENYYAIDTTTNRVNIKFQQTQSSPAFFTMPVEVNISFASGPDTLLRLMNTANGQQFSFTFTRKPAGVVFDPNTNIVLKTATTVRVTGIGLDEVNTLRYDLGQNYPNPFNPSTRIEFTLADVRPVTLKVYDILGKEVRTLINSNMNPGRYSIVWDAAGVPSGIYFYRLQAGKFAETKKLVIVR